MRNVARKAGGEADKAFMVLLEQIVIDTRAVIKPVHKSYARKFDEVFIARKVFTE